MYLPKVSVTTVTRAQIALSTPCTMQRKSLIATKNISVTTSLSNFAKHSIKETRSKEDDDAVTQTKMMLIPMAKIVAIPHGENYIDRTNYR